MTFRRAESEGPETVAPERAPEIERPVTVSLRLYRRLTSALPHEFKNSYQEDLLRIAEDSIEPIWRRHGVFGLMRMLLDLAIRVPVEYRRSCGRIFATGCACWPAHPASRQ
jgi:hypothetical protein